MRILIADDEALARRRLRALVDELQAGDVVGEAANGHEALAQAERLGPDVLLLDIRMPGMDGLEAAGHLAKLVQPPAVIFTTAYGDYALAAFEARAVDYLLKPIRKERLAQALGNARRLTRPQLTALEQEDVGAHARTHLSARVKGTIRLIPVETVWYFQAEQKYVTVCHRDGEVLIEESLRALEEEFGARFVRVHRNALVARAALEALERDGLGRLRIKLRGREQRLEVSRRHAAVLRRIMKG